MVRRASYIPDARDLVWLDFDPQAGHEQAGHRPALVMTSREYNSRTGLMICCPVTSKVKDNPLVVLLPKGVLEKESVVLVHHVRTVDFRARNAKFLSSVTYHVFCEVQDKLAAILELE